MWGRLGNKRREGHAAGHAAPVTCRPWQETGGRRRRGLLLVLLRSAAPLRGKPERGEADRASGWASYHGALLCLAALCWAIVSP
eukprot:362098-Chlamydomonas_euryale.AAC.3